jgi:hypothetical protein
MHFQCVKEYIAEIEGNIPLNPPSKGDLKIAGEDARAPERTRQDAASQPVFPFGRVRVHVMRNAEAPVRFRFNEGQREDTP